MVADFGWSPGTVHSALPHDALFGGHDSDGSQIFIGRSFFQGDQLPCKIIPSKNAAYVSYDGSEHFVDSFETLRGQGFEWVQSAGGSIPEGAFEAGFCKGGEPLFVGRVNFEGSLTPGKIQRSHGCLYIPYGGREHSFQSNFEVLVRSIEPPATPPPEEGNCCCSIQ